MEKKPEEKTMASTNFFFKISQDWSKFASAMTNINKIRFREEKLKAVELTKIFEQFRPAQTAINQAHFQAGSICVMTYFLRSKTSLLLHLSSL